jgi:integrase
MKLFKRIVGGKEQENYSVRFEHRGKAYLKSLGTHVKAEAEKRARDYHRLVTGAEWQDLRGALTESIAGRSETATVGLVLARYVERATDVAQRSKNADALRRILRAVFPSRDVDGMRTSELTKDVVRRFEAVMLERVGKEYRRYEASEGRVMTDYSVRTTIQTTLRCARSVFAPARMRYYEDMKLGDVAGFVSEPTQAPQRRRPQAPDASAIGRMVAALPELKERAPAVYCAFLLMARMGLRPVEVQAARVCWVRPLGEHFALDVIERPDEGFSPKGSEGTVPVAPAVWAELERFAHLRTDGYLVPGRTPTERAAVVERELSQWVGQFLRGRGNTTSYELRRWAGSLVLDAHNGDITAARDFLRHSDIKTTLEWYAYRINGVKPLGMDGLE